MLKKWICALLFVCLLLAVAVGLLLARYFARWNAAQQDAAEQVAAREAALWEEQERQALSDRAKRYAEQGFLWEDLLEIRYVQYDGELGTVQSIDRRYSDWYYQVCPYSPDRRLSTLALPRDATGAEPAREIFDKLIAIDALHLPWTNADGTDLFAHKRDFFAQRSGDGGLAEEHWTVQMEFRNHFYTWNVRPDDIPIEEMLAVRELVEELMQPHYGTCLALAEETVYELPEGDGIYMEYEIAKLAAQDWYRENGLNRLEVYDPFSTRSSSAVLIDQDAEDDLPEEVWQLVYYRDRYCWMFPLEDDLRFCYGVVDGERVTPRAEELVYPMTEEAAAEIITQHARTTTSLHSPFSQASLRSAGDGEVRYRVTLQESGSFGDLPFRDVATYWVDPLTGEFALDEWY